MIPCIKSVVFKYLQSICKHSRQIHLSCSNYITFNKLIRQLGNKLSRSEIETRLKLGANHIKMETALGPDSKIPISDIYVNQLAANHPLEDRFNVGFNQVEGEVSSLLFGVFDGHSGTGCVDWVNKMLVEYVAAAFLDHHKLVRVRDCLKEADLGEVYHIMRRLFHVKDRDKLVTAIARERLVHYVENLINSESRSMDPTVCLINAFEQLDFDICSSALSTSSYSFQQRRLLLDYCMSGSVGIVGRVFKDKNTDEAPTLHIASTGDSEAVLIRKEGESFVVHKLLAPHNAFNQSERERLKSEHSNQNIEHMLKDNRLLGELAPTRSFGDVRYKWSSEELVLLASQIKLPGDYPVLPPHYESPPYLTAKPDVVKIDLSKDDLYLVVATDGLWDNISPQMASEQVLSCSSPDSNPATKLLSLSLGQIAEGSTEVSYSKMSTLLSLKPGIARMFRDDTTIMVIKFSMF